MVIFVGKITYMEKLHIYYKIYEQIYENPYLPIDALAQKISQSRNTVSKYLKEMRENAILVGPHLYVNPARNYTQCIGLLTFSDPLSIHRGLNTFPHVIYHALTFGDWNILAVSDEPLDFSHLTGFENLVYWSRKGITFSPRVSMVDWGQAFEAIHRQIREGPHPHSGSRETLPLLTWGSMEWDLYHLFKYDARQKNTPIIRQMKVRYRTLKSWKDTLPGCCSFVTGFYPEGLTSYSQHCFLLETSYPQTVTDIFSLIPTSPLITRVDKGMLVIVHMKFPEGLRDLFCAIYDMQKMGIIERFLQASLVFHSHGDKTPR